MAERQPDVDHDYIEYVDAKIFHLKSRIKFLKEEINTNFISFINSVCQQQNKLLAEIDDKFDDVITKVTEEKLNIVRLSEQKLKLSNSESPLDKLTLKRIQNELQQLKNEKVQIPEIKIDWNTEAFKTGLEKIGKIETHEHPYTYLEHIKYSLNQSETNVTCQPKTFEIDWPTGDVLFLNSFEDKYGFNFGITAFDRFGAQKDVQNFSCKFERKFCPIGMCLVEESIFVSTTGKSAKTQLASIPKEMQSNIGEFKECVLKIDKSNGDIKSADVLEGIQMIGQIAFEPCDELFYIIDLKTAEMHVFDLELKKKRQFQLQPRPKPWLSYPAKIEHFQISKDDIFVVYDKKPHLEIYNLSGVLLRQLFDTFPNIYTIDPFQNIVTFESQSNCIQIRDASGREVAEVAKVMGKLDVVALKFEPMGIKFDILTGRILFCGKTSNVSKNKLGLVYL